MAQYAVTTVPVNLGGGNQLIQNLGPGVLYIGGTNVSVGTGFQVPTGKSVAIGSAPGNLYGASSATSDVRTLTAGTGVFTATA